MSNRVNKIKKSIKKPDALYNSLIGSIVCTIGITTGKSEAECRKVFNMLKRNKQVLPTTVEGIADYVWTIFGNNDLIKVRSSYVLITDNNNARTPMVTFVNDDGNVMPLRKEGFVDTNIISLAAEGRDYLTAEFIYDEDGNNIDAANQGDKE